MSGRTRIIASVAAVVLVGLLFFFLLIKPRRAELAQVREQIQTAENERQALQQQLAVLNDLKANAPKLQAELEEVEGFVPEDDEVPNFIFEVEQAAKQSGVGFVQITPELPKQPPEGAALAQVRTTIRARGGYFAIQDFMRRLYDLDRALRIDTIAMTAGIAPTGGETGTAAPATAEPANVTIELNLSARIFFELPEGTAATTPLPGATPAPGTTPAPATTPAPGTSPTPAGTPAPPASPGASPAPGTSPTPATP